MKFKNKLISIVLVLATAISIASCSNGVSSMDIDPEVTAEFVNDKADLVARGFIEAVFKKDEEMFNKCFPDGYIDKVKENGLDAFAEYTSVLTVDGEFLGTKYKAYNDYNEENGYDESFMRDSIFLTHNLSKRDDVEQIQIVKLDVLFNVDGKNMSTEVYFLVYKMGEKWFTFEMADADAEFKY